MSVDVSPVLEPILKSLCQQDYAGILLCNESHVIKTFTLDTRIKALDLVGVELGQWLPPNILNPSSGSSKNKRCLVTLPNIPDSDQFLASYLELAGANSLFKKVIALQYLPPQDGSKTDAKQVDRYKRALLSKLPIIFFHLDYQSKIFSEGLAEFAEGLGYDTDEIQVLDDGIYSLIHPQDMDAVDEQERALALAGDKELVDVKLRIKNKAGSWIWFQANSMIYERDEKGEPTSEIGALMAIFDDEQANESLRRQEYYFRRLVENSYDCVLVYDRNFNVTYVSPAIENLAGYTPEEIIKKGLLNYIHEDDRVVVKENIARVIENPELPSAIECRVVHKEGYLIWIESRLANRLDDPYTQGVTLNFHDISKRKKAEEKIHKLANYDPLTQLPNRYLLKKQLIDSLSQALKTQSKLALMYIDLDRFKEVNDSLGHSIGDVLLNSVARMIQACLRESDMLARIGGDEFAIVLPEINEKEAGAIASRILNQFKFPFMAGEHLVQTGTSIGISIYPTHTTNSEDLFRFADIAMYAAKKERNAYQFYQVHYSEQENLKRHTEKKLKQAIINGDLNLYYQPRVDIQTGEILSVEALCRWYDSDSGDVPPSLFIPIAEETGLINELSKSVIIMACKQIRAWKNKGLNVRIALNLSIRDLQNFNIVRQFSEAMRVYDIESGLLEVEITESAAMTDVINTVKVLNEFKELGIKLSIDDFGKGYSSLAYLSQLPVDHLKIDMYFVSQLGSNKKDKLVNINIIRSIISLARSLDLDTVGEGIETVQQMSILKSLGCDMGQGMLYCRPLSANAITKTLEKGFIKFPS